MFCFSVTWVIIPQPCQSVGTPEIVRALGEITCFGLLVCPFFGHVLKDNCIIPYISASVNYVLGQIENEYAQPHSLKEWGWAFTSSLVRTITPLGRLLRNSPGTGSPLLVASCLLPDHPTGGGAKAGHLREDLGTFRPGL